MIKWIKGILFEEEEEIVDESKLETLNFDNVKEDFNNILLDKPAAEQPAVAEEPVKEVVTEEKQKSFGIDLQPTRPVRETKEVKETREPVHRTVKPRTANTEKGEAVITTIISPIFGGSSDDKKKTHKAEPKVKPAKKKEVLGVISPIYGQNEDEVEEVNVFKHLAQTNTTVKENIGTIEDDYTLDDIIVNEETADECVQISLFGDETKELSVEEKEGM